MKNRKACIDALLLDKGVKFINDKIEFWFNFDSKLDDDVPDVFAGAITSLIYNGKYGKREFLDPVNAEVPFMYMFHDRYKRCMQVDEIKLFHNNDNLGIPIKLYSSSYEYHSHYRKDDMVSVVVLSYPFYSGDKIFRLRRVISLLDCYPCIVENVSLIDTEYPELESPDFSLSYCSHINSRGLPLAVSRHDKLHNGFIVSYNESIPSNMYFFNSNTRMERMPKDNPSFFSWTLDRTKCVVNVHSFARVNVYTDKILNDFICISDILAAEESVS